MKKFLVYGMLIGFTSSFALAGDLIVITNSATDISEGDIKDIFTGEKQTAGATKITVADNKAIQADFAQKALGMDDAKYQSTWQKKNFRDAVPLPKSKANDAEVIDFVKSTPGAVGYVGAATGDVKVVKKY